MKFRIGLTFTRQDWWSPKYTSFIVCTCVCVDPVVWTCAFGPWCVHLSQPQLQHELSVPTLSHTHVMLCTFCCLCLGPLVSLDHKSQPWSWTIVCSAHLSVSPASSTPISTQEGLIISWLVETGVLGAGKHKIRRTKGFFKSHCKAMQSSLDWSPLSYGKTFLNWWAMTLPHANDVQIYWMVWCGWTWHQSHAMAFKVTKSQPKWTPMRKFQVIC